MSKFKVLIASRSESAARAAYELLSKHPNLHADMRIISNGTVDPLHGLAELPDLLLLYDHNALGELETLQKMDPAVRPELLVFGVGDDAKSIRLAMRAGARDYLTLPLEQSELFDAIAEIRKTAAAANPVSKGRMHVFVNGKGGSGATFLATNTAHNLACDGHAVTIVDLDLQFAGLCRYLDLTPKEDIFEALRSLDRLDRTAAQAFTTHHESGLRLLSATGERLRMNQDVIPEDLIKLLDLYCSINDYVIVDLPRQIDGLSAAIIEQADQVTVVMQQSFPHLHDTARLVGILRNELHVDPSRINIVVNRYSKNLPILLKDIESALQTDKVIKIANHYRLTSESVNSGVPVDRKASISQGLKDLYPESARTDQSHRSGISQAFPSLFRR